MEESCQSCRRDPVVLIEALDDPAEPYRLCSACHRRRQTHSLRPLEWYRLSAIHGPDSDALSDAYYNPEDGTALQPSEPVTDAASFPCPRLQEVAGSPSDLLTYVLSRRHFHDEEEAPVSNWYIAQDLVAALNQHSPDLLHDVLGARLGKVRNPEIGGVLFHLIGLVLGPVGADLVRENWARFAGTALLRHMAFAASRCLPVAEGHRKVTDALAALNLRDRLASKLALLEFTTPLTLDWIEQNIESPVDYTWGLLAASSSFDWPRAEKWLNSGRPLSLAALDALVWCVCDSRKPPLPDPPAPADMIRRLEEHRANDPVVRVREKVDRLILVLRSK